MKIPEQLSALLKDNTDLRAAIDRITASVSTILSDNKLPFFPAYTDHGLNHVNDVLATMVRLIPKEVLTEKLLTANDAAVMVLGALLHDLAMHLRESGFQDLITGRWPTEKTKERVLPGKAEFGDRPWPDLWTAFLAEARKWDDAKLERLFGPRPHPQPPPPPPSPRGNHAPTAESSGTPPARDPWLIRDLSEIKSAWDEWDRLLAGEFIRRHHPRLAHEFAHHGFPGVPLTVPSESKDGAFPPPVDTLGVQHADVGDLAGAVARSHGMEMRRFAAILDTIHPDTPRPAECAPLYAATLLRIADYLQMDRKRAPAMLLHLIDPASTVSLDEWAKHDAVVRLNWTHKDPRCILVEAHTKHSLRTHLLLRSLLADVQAEMDKSVAVLAERYWSTGVTELSKLSLTKSRVQSNLDGKQGISSTLPYVPERITFTTAGPRLLELLIRPLYGNQWEPGIRELVQNATDAVKELRRYCEKHGEAITSLDFADHEGEVLLDLQRSGDGGFRLAVRDKGIGMTLETIRDYYLKAGASLRDSDAWKREFLDKDGKPTVVRSGRFGVGALAAFLLTDKIKVTTRHVADAKGYTFEASIGTDPIEIRPCEAKVGTTIEFEILHPVLSARIGSHWDVDFSSEDRVDVDTGNVLFDGLFAYWLDDVDVVVRRMEESSRRQDLLAGPFQPPLTGWWRTRVKNLGCVDWAWTDELVPEVIVNGLAARHDLNDHESIERPKLPPMPRLVVHETEGTFGLSLQRDRCDERWASFVPEVIADIERSIAACWIVGAPTGPFAAWRGLRFVTHGGKLNIRTHRDGKLGWFHSDFTFSRSESRLSTRFQGMQAAVPTVWLADERGSGRVSLGAGVFSRFPSELLSDSCFVGTIAWRPSRGENEQFSARATVACVRHACEREMPRSTMSVIVTRCDVSGLLDELADTSWDREKYNDKWVALYRVGQRPCQAIDILLRRAVERMPKMPFIAVVESNKQPESSEDSSQHSMDYRNVSWWFERVSKRYFGGDVVVPYDFVERRKKFANLDAELGPFIEFWERQFGIKK